MNELPTINQLCQTLHIRWMIRRDMESVLRIDSQSFEIGIMEEEMTTWLRQRNNIGMTATVTHSGARDEIVAFIVYGLEKNGLYIRRMAVKPEFRRQGVGSAIVRKLKDKLTPERRSRIELDILETQLDGQLFFKSCGFRATRVMENFEMDFVPGEHTAYEMRYCII